MSRWVFTEVDGGAAYTVPINPDKMSSPFHEREFQHAYGGRRNGERPFHTVESSPRPKEWTFEGVIRTQAHHDALELWSRKPGLVRITDHLGRTFEVLLTSFEPTDRRPNARTSWRLRYVMKALVLRQITV